MRGLHIATNAIIFIAIVVLVLVTISTFFLTETGERIESGSLEKQFATACLKLSSEYVCDEDFVPAVFVSDGVTRQSLSSICKQKGVATKEACAALCGCSVSLGSVEEPPEPSAEELPTRRSVVNEVLVR